MTEPNIQLSIVVPCFNEVDVLPETARQLADMLRELVSSGEASASSSVFFIDDGSNDGTWPLIERLHIASPCMRGIKLTRNRGHQNALLAGLLTVPGDVVISLDADLQDDITAIPSMLKAYREGAEIVYGVRATRQVDTAFKRLSARLYYRLLRVMDVEVVADHADFRLMGRRAIEALRQFDEVNLFLRGVIPLLGFSTRIVSYDRQARQAGTTKYSLTRMIALAFEGITSFSTAPLRLITWLGVCISMASMATGIWALFVKLHTGTAIPGWASTVVPLYFLGGIQMLSLGIIGGYLAKIYSESKRRPRFLIEKTL